MVKGKQFTAKEIEAIRKAVLLVRRSNRKVQRRMLPFIMLRKMREIERMKKMRAEALKLLKEQERAKDL